VAYQSSTWPLVESKAPTADMAESSRMLVPAAGQQLQLGDEEQIDERLARRAHDAETLLQSDERRYLSQ